MISSARSTASRCSRISTAATRRCGSPSCTASRAPARCCSCRCSAAYRRCAPAWSIASCRRPTAPASRMPDATPTSTRSPRERVLSQRVPPARLCHQRVGQIFRDPVDRGGGDRKHAGPGRRTQAALSLHLVSAARATARGGTPRAKQCATAGMGASRPSREPVISRRRRLSRRRRAAFLSSA